MQVKNMFSYVHVHKTKKYNNQKCTATTTVKNFHHQTKLFNANVSFDFSPTGVYKKYFMYYYSFLISKIVFVALNGTINPILYVCRMSEFRLWMRSTFMKTNFVRSQMTANNTTWGKGSVQFQELPQIEIK